MTVAARESSNGIFLHISIMRNINSSKLSRASILEKISQESIFSAYFNLSIDAIQRCINTGELICSPIREDKHPTVGFRYDNRGRLKMRDFSGVYWGDCFDAVATVLSTIYDRQFDVTNKKDFIDILRHITFTFKDVWYGKEVDPIISASIKKALTVIKHTKPIIEVVVREWNHKDEAYWNQFGITLKSLNTNFIYPVDQYYINRKTNPHPKYFNDYKDPCYCYHLGTDRNGVNNVKLYFPLRPKGTNRFITNSNHLEGIYNLDKTNYDIIIITKSTKDRLAISCRILKLKAISGFLNDLNIGVINIPHETYKLRHIEFNWLKSKLKSKSCIISLMDNDETGYNEADFLKSFYNIAPVFIPKRFDCKDFADFVKKTSEDDINKTIKTFITYYGKSKRSQLSKQQETDNVIPF